MERQHPVDSGRVTMIDAAAVADFHREGFLGPISLFDSDACSRLSMHVGKPDRPRRAWLKGAALNDASFYEWATDARVLAVIAPLLGGDIVLWGAQVVTSVPGHIHSWHTDIESSAPASRCVAVWIGFENTSRESGLQMMSRSHTFGKPVQQVAWEHRMRRSEASETDVLGWAKRCDPMARVVRPDVTDGSAIVFDGRLWHASNNSTGLTRRALLLQYADTGTPIFMRERDSFDWPFRYRGPAPVVHIDARRSTSAIGDKRVGATNAATACEAVRSS
jgi:hypothetical protein